MSASDDATAAARRVLDLLWRRDGREGAPGPKRGLTLDRIVEAAIALADADGLAVVSMRRVADALGVGTMSLYRYVPGKAELLDLMLDAALAEAEPVPEEGGWRVQLERLAHASMALYARHPWLVDLPTARPTLGPHVLDSYERLLRAVDGAGFTPAEMAAAVEAVDHLLRGAARAAQDVALAPGRTGLTDDEWWTVHEPFWREVFEPERYPAISGLYASGAYDAPEDGFAFGLARLLDGFEALLAGREPGPRLADLTPTD
jgi:AcrR family transcriptional regulator